MGIYSGDIAHYIQVCLYEGRRPDEDGWYVFSRDEISESLNISKQTITNSKDEVIAYLSSSTLSMSGYTQYKGQFLYDQLKYERGKFKFKRNPLSYNEEIKELWAMKPTSDYFAYDCFDSKHRRRKNGSYDPENPFVFPWSWSDEEIETTIKQISNNK